MPRQYPSRFGPPSVDDSSFAATLVAPQPDRPRLATIHRQPTVVNVVFDEAMPSFFVGSHPDRPRLSRLDRQGLSVSQLTHDAAPFSPEMIVGYHPDSPTRFGRGRQIGLPPEWVFIAEPFSISSIFMNRPLRPVLFTARYSRVVVQPPWPNPITGPVCLTTATGEAVTLSVAQALAPSPTVVLSTPKLSVTLFKC